MPIEPIQPIEPVAPVAPAPPLGLHADRKALALELAAREARARRNAAGQSGPGERKPMAHAEGPNQTPGRPTLSLHR